MKGVRRKDAYKTVPVLLGFVHMGEEPAIGDIRVLGAALERLTSEIGLEPTKMSVVGRLGGSRSQRFSFERFREAAAIDDTGTLYLDGAPGALLTLGIDLRYRRQVEARVMRFESVPQHSATIPMGDDASVRKSRAAAIETFLITVSAPSRPLHGGIAAIPSWSLSLEEVTMSAPSVVGPDGKRIKGRLSFDQRHDDELWTKARRAYWSTILGPDLAAAAGGVQAARATGATRVETRGDCLVVQATDDPADFLSPEWPDRAREIRRWIWPHTIQNPADTPD